MKYSRKFGLLLKCNGETSPPLRCSHYYPKAFRVPQGNIGTEGVIFRLRAVYVNEVAIDFTLTVAETQQSIFVLLCHHYRCNHHNYHKQIINKD